jgi:hypothetical protein
MVRTVTRSNGEIYSPTSLEVRYDLKMWAIEQRVNITETLNQALEEKMSKNSGVFNE